MALQNLERDDTMGAQEMHSYDLGRTAEALGIHRKMLQRMLRSYGFVLSSASNTQGFDQYNMSGTNKSPRRILMRGASRFPGPEEPLPDYEVEVQSFPAFAMRGASWRKGSRQVVSSASASSCIIGTTRPGTKRHRTSSNAFRCSATGRDGTRRWATSHRCSFWRIGVWLNTMKTW